MPMNGERIIKGIISHKMNMEECSLEDIQTLNVQ